MTMRSVSLRRIAVLTVSVLAPLFGALLGACTPHVPGRDGGSDGESTLKSYLGNPDYPDDFWQTATFEESHIDAARLEQARQAIRLAGWEIHSFLVARHGRLVFEQYGWNTARNIEETNKTPRQVVPTERHLVHSTTKSITSALVGIAIADGVISGLDQKAAASFPDYASLNPSPEKSAITLGDLLTMRSGLEWREGQDDREVFDLAPDPARAALSRPVVDTPVGQVWNYSSAGYDVVAEVLRVATGRTPLEYAKTKLFAPVGIVDPPWIAGRSGISHGGWGLSLTPREMARFGELFRNGGVWKGKQVVPAAWTVTTTEPKCDTPWGRQYATGWWVPYFMDAFNSSGAFGQHIFVSREKGLVVVFTADLENAEADIVLETLVRQFVLPAAY